ncbi:alpha/beta fold hydrolase [Amycolatopsis cihanbeyliensis]|uniref:Pimeloyl-ACP methyl ester carboxylesterase n=1 Tax=Amycolatopsis cihanbeyliensis TaxID=1128664 RepID=A0A542DP61_AMYCI|nr:alpha/beta hydrolase [Amycolatopsis cihanbeyliensis]TQJ04880.1 pimeloyl-ACP methyl ester carboxylesterase [Amycolatopsis cihanbeyliensis]
MTTLGSRPAPARRRRDPAPWDPAQAHRFVTSDGTALHVESAGDDKAPLTLVLVHGWTQDHRTWDAVAGGLPRAVGEVGDPLRLLRYDLRGHGASAPARPGTATIERLADDLAELIADRVPHGRLVLVGHSMGGMTLMCLAERHPELVSGRVDAIGLVATSSGDLDRVTLGLPGLFGGGAARIEQRITAFLRRRRRDALPLAPRLVRPFARWLVFGDRPRRTDVASVAEQVVLAHPASIAGFRDSMAVHDRRVALAALRGIPAVVLAGGRDRLCPPPHAMVLAEELPEAEFVRFPGVGHMLPQERSREVTERIARLVRAAAR